MSDPLLPTPEDSGLAPARSRESSVTLREAGAEQDEVSMMDPANQSLADALNILLKIIYFGVAALGVAYLLSGLTWIKEGERGVSLLFGAVRASDLEPGPRWSPPFPLGELIRVDQGVQEVAINRDFWLYLQDETDATPLDDLAASSPAALKPDQGGSGAVITGDGNLAHCRWSARYRRSGVTEYARNILPDQEPVFVRAAVKRAIVKACAETPIEQLLRQSAGLENSVAARARELAQKTLDDAQSGLIVELLSMTDVTPPLFVRKDFQRVQAADSRAQQNLESARTGATATLNAAAGDAAPHLVEMIAAYELATVKQDERQLSAVLAEIQDVLRGKPIVVEGEAPRRVSGTVTKIISDAEAYRTQMASRSRAELANYEAKLAQFETNPLVMVQSEWRDAMGAFLGRKTVSKILLPRGRAGDVFELILNKDPWVEREQEKAIKEAEARRAMEAQQDRQRRTGLTTQTETVQQGGRRGPQ